MTPAVEAAIIIPTFDSQGLLRRAVQSVVAQTHVEWELVVVDDSGTEDLGWVDRVDARVRLVRQKNAGVSIARNAGVLETTAPILCFLDQDDAWEPPSWRCNSPTCARPELGSGRPVSAGCLRTPSLMPAPVGH